MLATLKGSLGRGPGGSLLYFAFTGEARRQKHVGAFLTVLLVIYNHELQSMRILMVQYYGSIMSKMFVPHPEQCFKKKNVFYCR
jgi:hypothetical protein